MLRTNRQTDEPNILPTPTDRVGVGRIYCCEKFVPLREFLFLRNFYRNEAIKEMLCVLDCTAMATSSDT